MTDKRDDNGQQPMSQQLGPPGQAIPGMYAQPGPLMSVVNIAQGGDGSKWVAVRLETALGMIVLFFDADHADRFGKLMQQKSVEAKLSGGLTIAGPNDIPPPTFPPSGVG